MPIVHVTPLGASSSDVAGAVAQIIDYLERGSKTPQPNASLSFGYYADSSEGPGVWRGRGVAGRQLHGRFDSDVLREILSGRHPDTGERLVSSSGSAGRANANRANANPAMPDHATPDAAMPDNAKSEHVPPPGPPEQLLSTEQTAALLGTSARYVREIAVHVAHESLDAEQRIDRVLQPVGGSKRARLQGVQLDDRSWLFRRDAVERFANARVEPKTVVAYDVTLSVEKSISLAWVHASRDERLLIESAIDAGVNAAVGYLEDHALHVRRGRGSQRADGVWAASYRHITNRLLEPQLHEHILIANVAASVGSSVTQAIDARHFMHHAKTAGYVAGAVIRHRLSESLGVAWLPVEQGIADLAGVPRSAIDAMSTRRKEVTTLVGELGLDGLAARQFAALTTRAAKTEPTSWDDLETQWRDRLREHGFDRDDWLQLRQPGERDIAAFTTGDVQRVLDFLDSPMGVTKRAGIFSRREVVQSVIDFDASFGSNRLDLETIDLLTDRFLAGANVVPVEVADHQMVRTGETAWFTTTATIRLERSVMHAYDNGRDQKVAAASPETIRAAINAWESLTGHHLGTDQTQMVETICASTDQYAIVVGPAGTGKTAAVEVAARAWEASGFRPLGVSVTGAAADQLGASTGIATRTVASLLESIRQGINPLDERTVLVVDEASTLSNRDHHALVRAVDVGGARMVSIGDPAQHRAVDAGGLWAHLTSTHPTVVRLDTNRRQATESMTDVRIANADYRDGRIGAALQRLEANDRIVTADTATELLDELCADWYVDRQHHEGKGAAPRMMAEQHSIRKELNRRAQALLRADGTLTGSGMTVGDETFHVGDEVVTRTRDNNIRFADGKAVRNSSHGTITHIAQSNDGRTEISVRFDGRGTVRFDHDYLTRHIRPGVRGGLTPAYAVTTHVAQGATYSTGRMIASDTSSRAGVYVGLTRGTSDARLYAVMRRDLEPDTQTSDVGLPIIRDIRTTTEALVDQLSKKEATMIVNETNPTIDTITALTKQRLQDLRLQAATDPDAATALAIMAQRIATRALAEPSAELLQRFGPRPSIDSSHRPIWDTAVRELTTFKTIYGSLALPSNPTLADERNITSCKSPFMLPKRFTPIESRFETLQPHFRRHDQRCRSTKLASTSLSTSCVVTSLRPLINQLATSSTTSDRDQKMARTNSIRGPTMQRSSRLGGTNTDSLRMTVTVKEPDCNKRSESNPTTHSSTACTTKPSRSTSPKPMHSPKP